ncbi:MAG: carbamoyl phosphate synthase small subunit, partial [Endomicrobiia bacterium]
MADGILMLETGMYFKGKIFGYEDETFGEVVFNTGLVGYEEILTDPSYKGQIVVMTYPHIGNYGITYYDFESVKPQVEGFVIHEFSKVYSNWQAKFSLDKILKKYKIVGIEGVDTRALTKYLRDKGSMMGIISAKEKSLDILLKKVRQLPSIVGRDLVKEVIFDKEYKPFAKNVGDEKIDPYPLKENIFYNFEKIPTKYKVVVIDCGCKFNILRSLRNAGCDLIVVPANTSYEKILDYTPDGVFISNGPGDPEAVPYVFKTVEKIISYMIST